MYCNYSKLSIEVHPDVRTKNQTKKAIFYTAYAMTNINFVSYRQNSYTMPVSGDVFVFSIYMSAFLFQYVLHPIFEMNYIISDCSSVIKSALVYLKHHILTTVYIYT